MSVAMDRLESALRARGSKKSGGNWTCPAHDDANPSLSVRAVDDGKVLVHCHAGCSTEGVLEALSMTLADLYDERAPEEPPAAPQLCQTYDYVDEHDEHLFQVCRYQPKAFRQRRPDGKGNWIWSLDGVPRVLYRLPAVLETVAAGNTVYVVEGERDVHSIESLGHVATCNPGGAGNWKDDYSGVLQGAKCTIVADSDVAGLRHALKVVRSLEASGAMTKIVHPAHGSDVTEHLEAGFGLEDLVRIRLEDLEDVISRGKAVSCEGRHKKYARSDTGNASLFSALNWNDIRYDHRLGRWLVWDQHHWQPDLDGEILRKAQATARQRYRNAADIADSDKRIKEARYALTSENQYRLRAMIEVAKSHLAIADKESTWDWNPMLLGVTNGVVDLTTGRVRPGQRLDRVTTHVGLPYDQDATCPRWVRFLAEVFDEDFELVDFVHRAVGYSLTADVGEQCLFLLHGLGANGKSTLLNVLREFLGGYACNTPFSTLEKIRGSSIPNDVAALVGRRFVTASEASEGFRLDEGRVKALTGGDTVTARFLHQEYFTFKPVAKFWLAMNHKPRVTDDSHGFWRRVHLIPFTRQFPIDKNLEPQLLNELPGILTWAAEGCRKWLNQGLEPPESVRSATEEYRRESDHLDEFVAESIEETDAGTLLPTKEIARAYGEWADAECLNKRERLGSTSLKRRFKARWPDRHRPGTRNVPSGYLGLRLVRSEDV